MLKNQLAVYRATLLFLLLVFAASTNAQDDKYYQSLALRLVQSSSIKPGDVVLIEGGKHMIPLMEATAIETQKLGGMPVLLLDSDRALRSLYTEVPEKYLEQEPRFWGEWLKSANVFIGLPWTDNVKSMIDGVPESRFAKLAKASSFFAEVMNSAPVRNISIDFPTKQDADRYGMDFPMYEKMMLDAINADYAAVSRQGQTLREMLKTAKQIRVTSPAGTDFTFSPAPGRDAYVDDGIVTEERAKSKLFAQKVAALPGGNVFFAPLETSANGKVVVPHMSCRMNPMNDVTFDFKKGQIQNFKAATNGECFQETMKPYAGPKDVFGRIWFGINPALRVVEDGKANFRPFNAAGMVYVGVGDNRIYGGANTTDTGYTFPITNASVTIDGKIVIKNGKLVL